MANTKPASRRVEAELMDEASCGCAAPRRRIPVTAHPVVVGDEVVGFEDDSTPEFLSFERMGERLAAQSSGDPDEE